MKPSVPLGAEPVAAVFVVEAQYTNSWPSGENDRSSLTFRPTVGSSSSTFPARSISWSFCQTGPCCAGDRELLGIAQIPGWASGLDTTLALGE